MPPSRRDELIDAAMRVFYRYGFHASSLDDILKEGGISRMTLYNHFKSKDELILAAMRRRDEIFRNKLMRFVESKAKAPRDRIAAVFDFHEDWFTGTEFCGCMFINAAAEFSSAESAPRRLAADHKQEIVRYLRELCQQDGLKDPDIVAEQLNILLEGAIVAARVVGQVQDGGENPGASARLAKQMALDLLDRCPKNE
ncbi:MAG: TetR/AcrR family transcriptional regulator [Phycisphaerales bacterium JB052]